MIIPTNVIVVTTVLKTISTFLNTLTPITFTKLSNVTIVENYLLMLVISVDTSFAQADSLRGHIKTVHEGDKDFRCESCGNHLLKLVI